MDERTENMASTSADYAIFGLAPHVLSAIGLDQNTSGLITASISAVLKLVSFDLLHRQISNIEKRRLGTALNYTVEKIQQKLNSGFTPRYADISDKKSLKNAEEIFEGVLLKCKEQYEQKKLKYIANIYVNWLFDETISPEQIYWIIKISERLTFSQFCLISIFANESYSNESLPNHDLSEGTLMRINIKEPSEKVKNYYYEIDELINVGILHNYITHSYGYNVPSWSEIILGSIIVTSLGANFYKVLNLETIESETLLEIFEQISYGEKVGSN